MLKHMGMYKVPIRGSKLGVLLHMGNVTPAREVETSRACREEKISALSL